MKIGKVVALFGAVFACASCQYAPDMLDRTLAYNRAVADSTNQVLLLNIVRASERLPTYYTRLEGDASSLALTPSAGISLPLANARSFESDLSTAATGAVTSGATKGITSLGSLAGTLGMQGSESNLLTLQNLDDQKYQNGMMTPVALKNIEAFQDQGYQRDLLFMMFFSSIQVSSKLLVTIDSAVTARCAQMATEPGNRVGGVSFTRQICAYIRSDPYRTLFSSDRIPAGDTAFSLKTCQDTGGAISDDPPSDMVRFSNDPAREGRRDSLRDPHPAVCFQILLNDLLVLGLKVGSAQDAPAELIDAVPDAVAQNPQFRTQMIQQNFFVRQAANGISAICRKKSQDNSFTLTFTNPDNSGRQENAVQAPLNELLQQLGVPASNAAPAPRPAPPPEKHAAKSAPATPPVVAIAYPVDPLAACQQKSPGPPESPKEAALASSDDVVAELKGSEAKPVKLDHGQDDVQHPFLPGDDLLSGRDAAL